MKIKKLANREEVEKEIQIYVEKEKLKLMVEVDKIESFLKDYFEKVIKQTEKKKEKIIIQENKKQIRYLEAFESNIIKKEIEKIEYKENEEIQIDVEKLGNVVKIIMGQKEETENISQNEKLISLRRQLLKVGINCLKKEICIIIVKEPKDIEKYILISEIFKRVRECLEKELEKELEKKGRKELVGNELPEEVIDYLEKEIKKNIRNMW